jgi:superfamily II DNA helicase RecQ
MSPNYRFFRSSARRDNLAYQVRSKTNKVLDDMAEFIQTHHPSGAGIVYTFSRKEADTVAEQLCERGIVAESYHSAVSDSKKDAIHRSWMRNETQVVVATIAFGLGINKPDVRFVLHHRYVCDVETV